mmetsp:Transcript_14223/g.27276  ORF Transcript_14223/g.27276 Transcript_14223/m.27276 type:complete len:135 (-) Transcript_14223:429-833(-)
MRSASVTCRGRLRTEAVAGRGATGIESGRIWRRGSTERATSRKAIADGAVDSTTITEKGAGPDVTREAPSWASGRPGGSRAKMTEDKEGTTFIANTTTSTGCIGTRMGLTPAIPTLNGIASLAMVWGGATVLDT